MRIIAVMLITVSLPLMLKLVKAIKADWEEYAVYPWAAVMLLCAFILKDNLVFRLPESLDRLALVYIIVPIAVLFIVPRLVPLRFIGAHGRFKGIVMYPIFEEIAFRGLILPLLLAVRGLDISIRYIAINGAVIISAALFGLMHILSYGINKASLRIGVFAFIGGLYMGYLAYTTLSILPSIVYHMAWNTMLSIGSVPKAGD